MLLAEVFTVHPKDLNPKVLAVSHYDLVAF